MTGSTAPLGATAGAASSPAGSGSKHAMSVMAPTRSSAQRTRTRIPVDTSSGEETSSACRNGFVAPSKVTSAKAKGRSKGWPLTGSGTQVHEVTVPRDDTSTKSSSAWWDTGSYSGGGTTTWPSEVRPPTTTPSRRPVRNRPRTGPVERV